MCDEMERTPGSSRAPCHLVIKGQVAKELRVLVSSFAKGSG